MQSLGGILTDVWGGSEIYIRCLLTPFRGHSIKQSLAMTSEDGGELPVVTEVHAPSNGKRKRNFEATCALLYYSRSFGDRSCPQIRKRCRVAMCEVPKSKRS